jgi:hypothetical protein
MKPTFIGIGAQKCASTWLYNILEEHPDVGLCPEKEINFFTCHYDRGYQWYERQFGTGGEQQAVGELSTSYLSDLSAPARVHSYVPSARILISLRDPVQRALSNHRHEIRLGNFIGSDLSFEAGLENNPMYLEQGLYATHLKRWLDYFPMDQVHVLLLEEIRNNSIAVARSVYDFLGVDDSYEPKCLTRYFNKSYANRYQPIVKMKDSMYRLTRLAALRWVWSLGHTLGMRNLYRRFNTMSSDSVIPEPDVRTIAKVREYFAPEVRELSGLIGKTLDNWL